MIGTTTTDFVDIETKEFHFHTASDGFGPYHVIVPTSKHYLQLEVSSEILPADKHVAPRFPSFFIDTVAVETTEDTVAVETTDLD